MSDTQTADTMNLTAYTLKLIRILHVDAEAFRQKVVQYPVPEKPTLLDPDRQDWFDIAAQEELTEFRQACADHDVKGAVDALWDLAYFTIGRIIEMGVPPEPVAAEIQRANMTKERGELAKRPGSQGYDAVKPPGWQGPDHSWIEEFTTYDAENLRHRAARRARIQADAARQRENLENGAKQALKFSAGKPPFTLIPIEGMEAEALAFDYGRHKYAAWNHTLPGSQTALADAAARHIWEWVTGVDVDPESGVHVLGHARACLSMLLTRIRLHPEWDDRRTPPSK